jgi:hypothetical protein
MVFSLVSSVLMWTLCSSFIQSYQPSLLLNSRATTNRLSSTNRNTQLYLSDIRRPFISGNWKLNPQTRDEAIQLASDIAASVTSTTPNADIALFVPYVFIESTMNVVDNKLMVGAEVRVRFL